MTPSTFSLVAFNPATHDLSLAGTLDREGVWNAKTAKGRENRERKAETKKDIGTRGDLEREWRHNISLRNAIKNIAAKTAKGCAELESAPQDCAGKAAKGNVLFRCFRVLSSFRDPRSWML